MIAVVARLADRARSTALAQAARVIELAARVQGSGRTFGGVGGDTPLKEEPLRFSASDRMAMPLGDLAEIRVGDEADGQVRVVANVMGLVGATPALPAPGGEMCTPEEVDRICKRFAVGRYSQHRAARDPSRPTEITTHADPARPCRPPTREDYLRMGVAPEVLDRTAAPPPPNEQRDAA